MAYVLFQSRASWYAIMQLNLLRRRLFTGNLNKATGYLNKTDADGLDGGMVVGCMDAPVGVSRCSGAGVDISQRKEMFLVSGEATDTYFRRVLKAKQT